MHLTHKTSDSTSCSKISMDMFKTIGGMRLWIGTSTFKVRPRDQIMVVLLFWRCKITSTNVQKVIAIQYEAKQIRLVQSYTLIVSIHTQY